MVVLQANSVVDDGFGLIKLSYLIERQSNERQGSEQQSDERQDYERQSNDR